MKTALSQASVSAQGKDGGRKEKKKTTHFTFISKLQLFLVWILYIYLC